MIHHFEKYHDSPTHQQALKYYCSLQLHFYVEKEYKFSEKRVLPD